MHRTDDGSRVDNAPLREAFLASGLTAYGLAKRLGWKRNPNPSMIALWAGYSDNPPPDATRVKRALGLLGSTKNGRCYLGKTLPYDQAVAICRALDLDPIDVGL